MSFFVFLCASGSTPNSLPSIGFPLFFAIACLMWNSMLRLLLPNLQELFEYEGAHGKKVAISKSAQKSKASQQVEKEVAVNTVETNHLLEVSADTAGPVIHTTQAEPDAIIQTSSEKDELRQKK
jgi:hypothetical protein